jgi:hypothetical protein
MDGAAPGADRLADQAEERFLTDLSKRLNAAVMAGDASRWCSLGRRARSA